MDTDFLSGFERAYGAWSAGEGIRKCHLLHKRVKFGRNSICVYLCESVVDGKGRPQMGANWGKEKPIVQARKAVRLTKEHLRQGRTKERREATMDLQQTIVFLVIGGVAGWLAGLILKGGGFGILGNIIVGILGAVVGGWLFRAFNISVGGDWLGPIVMSTVGAVVLLFVIGLIRPAK